MTYKYLAVEPGGLGGFWVGGWLDARVGLVLIYP